MARTKRHLSGWIILDKPLGMTSTQAVGKIRWLYSAEKAGHAGTLDPLASGVLPIALGEATKAVPYMQQSGKRYRFTVKWGEATTTDDAEGEIVATSAHHPTEADVLLALPLFTGTIQQRPPIFSAIKLDGERAYDLARAGERVELVARPVTIDSFTLLRHDSTSSDFEMACEKGTYVRSLARDLAEHLGTRGHVIALRRMAVGAFDEATTVTLEQIEQAVDRDALLLPVARSLAHLPEIRIAPDDAALIRNGNPVLLRGPSAPVSLHEAWTSLNGTVIAIGRVEAGHFKPARVLNTGERPR